MNSDEHEGDCIYGVGDALRDDQEELTAFAVVLRAEDAQRQKAI